ncbi:gamma-glutamyl-gamma-aminobutyrate hydrolase family protein [Elstera sp.]|jgi:putative glutamine amidotransferase|uniref:gamma-glutamyl-gamma-aminobutyrate hydrolase family protein n=1 Tax=Elstera sp. TaxID=1916664 RepID=UPI0037C15643
MTKKPSRPLIGLTLDSEPAGGWAKQPWYAIRQNYCDAIAAAGGLPVCLPHEPDLALAYLDHIQGVVVTGGAFDVDPSLFGATVKHATVTTKDRRTAFELALMRGLLAKDLPILGICGGQQLLAVALGGTLVQHLPDEIPSDIPHEQPNPRTEAGHEVIVAANTLLHRIVGQERIPVNSAHHQAVKAVPASILVNASAPDGVIEGIEDPTRRFCLGVQWHPEYHISPADRAIFNALIAASAA